ncbi:MAG TPA: toll/interleukin-1 receptor domain-containing protein [Dehalococcoidia bacterium]|jgi:hypothetical protein|nr:toll/interleukin-1 receptor domain-containing protein [Dehalococcoidia bacterium]
MAREAMLKEYGRSATDRARLSALTRRATEAGQFIEITSDWRDTLLPRAPRFDLLDGMRQVLEYLDKQYVPGGPAVLIDPRRDQALVAAPNEAAMLEVLKSLAKEGLIERGGVSAELRWRLTTAGYRQLREHRRLGASPDSISPVSVKSGDRLDVFISHASEDKAEVARPLFELLTDDGLKVWFDEAELRLGDSLRRKIDDGLARCRYGVVILSPSFFAKEWPQRELDGLVAREAGGQKVILPIWHRVTRDDVVRYSPTLADKYAVNTAKGLPSIVVEIQRALK